MFNNILIIGLGLIGGSIAKSIRKANNSHNIENINNKAEVINHYSCNAKIFGLDKDVATIELAIKERIIDDKIDDLSQDDITAFDLIIIASPLASYQNILAKIANNKIHQNLLIIDCGSVKSFIANILPDKLQNIFISAHPIAGSQLSKIDNADGELFVNKKIIITNQDILKQHSKAKDLEIFFNYLGMSIVYIDSKLHDYIYGLVSHLPQFLSFANVFYIEEVDNDQNILFDKILRLNYSNRELWYDIFTKNKIKMMFFYDKFFANLLLFRDLIATKQMAALAITIGDSYRNLYKIYQNNNIDINHYEKFAKIDNKFIKNNRKFLLRLLIVSSFIRIEEINKSSNYIGTGFVDFTIIMLFWYKSAKIIIDYLKKNHKLIVKDINIFLYDKEDI